MKWAAGLVLIAACGEGAMSIEEYSAARLDVACDYLVRCGVTPSIENCLATRSAPRFDTELLAALDAGTVRWNGDAAEDCVAGVDRLSCDRTSESYRQFACEPLFSGTLGDGEACTMSVECISNECWTEGCSDACCTGYCVGETPPTVGAIGEVCRLSGCETAAFCENSVCVPLRGEGEACSFDECGYGLTCVDRLCRASIDRGLPCTSTSECRMLGDRCTSRGVCAPASQFGEECVGDDDCASHYLCDVDQRCAPAPRIGEHCQTFYFDQCFDAGAFCDELTSMCSLPKPDGAACTYPVECESYDCFEGTCIACSVN